MRPRMLCSIAAIVFVMVAGVMHVEAQTTSGNALPAVSLAEGQNIQLNVMLPPDPILPPDPMNPDSCDVVLKFVDKNGDVFVDDTTAPVEATRNLEKGETKKLRLKGIDAFAPPTSGKRVLVRPVVERTTTPAIPTDCNGVRVSIEVFDATTKKTEFVIVPPDPILPPSPIVER